jgi:hypothetical protein
MMGGCVFQAEGWDLACVVRGDRAGRLERESAAVCGDGIFMAAALGEQRTSSDVQLRPPGEPGAGSERVDDCQSGGRPFGIRDGDGTVCLPPSETSGRFGKVACDESVVGEDDRSGGEFGCVHRFEGSDGC